MWCSNTNSLCTEFRKKTRKKTVLRFIQVFSGWYFCWLSSCNFAFMMFVTHKMLLFSLRKNQELSEIKGKMAANEQNEWKTDKETVIRVNRKNETREKKENKRKSDSDTVSWIVVNSLYKDALIVLGLKSRLVHCVAVHLEELKVHCQAYVRMDVNSSLLYKLR